MTNEELKQKLNELDEGIKEYGKKLDDYLNKEKVDKD